ncbi:type IX secretion system membrane protein PorP/SprF [Mucilaginibacter sp. UR6-11]|uniref:PorP/SprF family type IX secretion system membrane protein n=1 Tax=Mucilaginibacter sp. UR6-11 TaxID=1435644 RepID=UPI001E3D7AA4|nr:type IX secretion system membrane protein PorP/SprF [Mucilaginibacter sp. UR6-11]MCC8425838.1 type IX secretion system membrane protein PorP/SprF [Mucilaginibacter sp. UR6-11]
MNCLKKYILSIIIILGLSKSYAQQTIQLSQYIFNGLVVNPAYAGYKEDWTVNLSSRLQWVGVDGAPKTGTLSVDGVTDPDTKNIGLGLLVTNDRLGPENNSAVYANYAYRIRLNNDDSQRLCFGVGVGAIVYTIDGSLFNTGSSTDPAISPYLQNKLAPDFRAGVYYYSPLFYLGASALNLIPNAYPDPVSIFIKEVRTYYLTTGFVIPVSSDVNWKPSVLYKEDFKGPSNISAASYFLFGDILWVGASYSTSISLWNKPNLQGDLNKNGALTGAVAVNITPQCRFGYSYDFGTGKLSGYQSASHEVSFSYSFKRAKGRILSPRFF